jgi:hypothetical protein
MSTKSILTKAVLAIALVTTSAPAFAAVDINDRMTEGQAERDYVYNRARPLPWWWSQQSPGHASALAPPRPHVRPTHTRR